MKILLINDTSSSVNMGCQANMYGLYKVLRKYTKDITLKKLHEKYTLSDDELKSYDKIIINGEGSVKNNLNDIDYNLIDRCNNIGIPIHLINCTIDVASKQDLLSLINKIKKCTSISVREPLSFSLLKPYLDCKLFPDMATNVDKSTEFKAAKNTILIGDGSAVNIYYREGKFFKYTKSNYIKLCKFILDKTTHKPTLVICSAAKNMSFMDCDEVKEVANIIKFPTFDQYLWLCKNSLINFTGRHHGTILSFIAGCPFVLQKTHGKYIKTIGDNYLYGPCYSELFDFKALGKHINEIYNVLIDILNNKELYTTMLKNKFNNMKPYFESHIQHIFEDVKCMSREEFDWDKINYYRDSIWAT